MASSMAGDPHNAKPGVEWFETLDDALWLRPDEGGEGEAEFVHRALRLRPGQRLLDAPCGAGRVALPLARRGIQVTGIDLREAFVERARRRATAEGLAATFRAGDLRTVDFGTACYHGVCNWFNSFGYFDEADDTDLLRRWAAALEPGGRLLIDQFHRERILRDFRPVSEHGGITYRSRWDPATERLHVHRVIDGVDAPGNRSSQRLYTPGQLRARLQAAGLRVEGFWGSMAGEGLGRGSRLMLVVAVKPGAFTPTL